MPKAIQYRTNSVIYFQNDMEDKIYILQKGAIISSYQDIETGETMHERICQGEFFGVKSALGHFPREETVMVVSDAIVLSFTSAEFESFALSNTRIIMKMLKVFSNQLRKIHKQTVSLLHSTEEGNQSDGLFSVAQAFSNAGNLYAAADIANRYLATYPTGEYASKAKAMAMQGNRSAVRQSTQGSTAVASPDDQLNIVDDKQSYILGEQLLSRGKYNEAFAQFQNVLKNESSSLKYDAMVQCGRCLCEDGSYADAIKLLTKMIMEAPKHRKTAEALFFMGVCNKRSDVPDKAEAFFQKALAMTADIELAAKIKKEMNGGA